jgi:hypothetical protein
LRQHGITPPSIVSATYDAGTVDLEWSAGESGCVYDVYSAAEELGPYVKRTTSGPVSGTTWSGSGPNEIYMVRALKLVTSGRGSYTNISQGIMTALTEE